MQYFYDFCLFQVYDFIARNDPAILYLGDQANRLTTSMVIKRSDLDHLSAIAVKYGRNIVVAVRGPETINNAEYITIVRIK